MDREDQLKAFEVRRVPESRPGAVVRVERVVMPRELKVAISDSLQIAHGRKQGSGR